MTTKQLKLLALALLFLVGIWGLQRQLGERNDDQVASQVRLDPEIDPLTVSRIAIVRGDEKLTLARENTEWFVMEATESSTLAKTEDVDSLLKILDGVDVELVSQSQERQAALGIRDEEAHRIEYGNGEQVSYTLLVSKDDPRLVRQAERTNVYRWGFELSRLVNTSVANWLAPSPTPTPATPSEPVSDQ